MQMLFVYSFITKSLVFWRFFLFVCLFSSNNELKVICGKRDTWYLTSEIRTDVRWFFVLFFCLF